MKKEDKITAEQYVVNEFPGMSSGDIYEFTREDLCKFLNIFASSQLPVQEQSKQEVMQEISNILYRRLNQFCQTDGKSLPLKSREFIKNEILNDLNPLISLPQEQKDKVTGVSDEEIRQVIFQHSRPDEKDCVNFIANLRSLLSSKAEQVCDTTECHLYGLNQKGVCCKTWRVSSKAEQKPEAVEQIEPKKPLSKITDEDALGLIKCYKKFLAPVKIVRIDFDLDEGENLKRRHKDFIVHWDCGGEANWERYEMEWLRIKDAQYLQSKNYELPVYFSPPIQEAEHKQGVTEETSCAKLRNQLSPFYNLVSMILKRDDRLGGFVIKEAEQCEKNKVKINELLKLIEEPLSLPLKEEQKSVTDKQIDKAIDFGFRMCRSYGDITKPERDEFVRSLFGEKGKED